MANHADGMQSEYARRASRRLTDRIRRILEPPRPFVMNPREQIDAPLGARNLYIGGAGRSVPGYVNLDLFAVPGVDVASDAEALPFPDRSFDVVLANPPYSIKSWNRTAWSADPTRL